MITLTSIIRNGEHYLDRYFRQVADLMDVIPDLRHVVGEGDSTDGSRKVLEALAPNTGAEILDVSHGGPRFGSVDHPERWANIAKSVRQTLDYIGDPGQKFVWVEADLLWDVDTMMRLLAGTEFYSAVAPMLFAYNSDRFYDTWGYRIGGKGFLGGAPYLPEETIRSDEDFYKIESCGSCFAANTDPQYGNNVRDWVMHGWDGMWPATCDGMLWLDHTLEVYHP